MWIRTGNVICHTDEFCRFYVEEMPNRNYGVFGKQTENLSTLLGEYRSHIKAREVFDTLYAALERGDKAFTMPNSAKRW